MKETIAAMAIVCIAFAILSLVMALLVWAFGIGPTETSFERALMATVRSASLSMLALALFKFLEIRWGK